MSKTTPDPADETPIIPIRKPAPEDDLDERLNRFSDGIHDIMQDLGISLEDAADALVLEIGVAVHHGFISGEDVMRGISAMLDELEAEENETEPSA